jgi:chitin disaccharide deacetylase
MRRLIVTADDLGLAPTVTDGILLAAREGIVRAASLIVPGEDSRRALEMAQAVPALAVGVHLTLVEVGAPLLGREAPSLLRGGGFRRSLGRFAAAWVSKRIGLSDIEREFRAQIESAIAWGLRPSHLDGHKHLHQLPGVFELTCQLARDYGVPRVRVTRSGWRRSARTGLGALALEGLSLRAARVLRGYQPLQTTDQFLGRDLLRRGLDAEALCSLLDRVEGTCELIVHPGLRGPRELLGLYPWGAHWHMELAALTSSRVLDRVDALGIELVGEL